MPVMVMVALVRQPVVMRLAQHCRLLRIELPAVDAPHLELRRVPIAVRAVCWPVDWLVDAEVGALLRVRELLCALSPLAKLLKVDDASAVLVHLLKRIGGGVGKGEREEPNGRGVEGTRRTKYNGWVT